MNWNFFILCMWFALSGIEYAIILPTINEFLEKIDDSNEQIYLGISLSAFSFTSLIFSPVYGRITDTTNSLKFTVIFSNLFEIGGNFLYMASTKAWMVVVSRLIAGIGSGSGASIFGIVSKTTNKKERTSKMAQLMSVRQIGLLVGPAFNFLIEKMNFNMGSVHVNSLSGAGFFMAVIWSVYTLIILFFYKQEEDEEQVEDETRGLLNNNATNYGSTSQVDVDNKQQEQQQQISANENSEANQALNWSNIYNDLFREEVIVCLSATFFIMFIQTGFETILTPLTSKYFGWNSLDNSLFFLGAGIDVLIGFFVMAKISKYISDRLMLISAFTACFILIALFIPLVQFAGKAEQGTTWVYVCFIVHSTIFIFVLPFLFTPHVSLFSKITSRHSQAFNQGFRISVRGIGQIIGPLWASSLLNNGLPFMVCINLVTCGIILFMMILSYDRLKVDLSEEEEEGQAVNA